MLNSYWLSAPFLIQTLCMAVDEFWFHRKRGLPRWERIGHPLDTLTVVICLVWILCIRPNQRSVLAYVALAAFSCLFVTKDEPVHKRHCPAAEHWLHAVLFALHPIVLSAAALLWPAIQNNTPPALLWGIRYSGFEHRFLAGCSAAMVGFAIYQFVFWNLLWHPRENARETR